ncbi:MAG: hypothetical protein RLZZ175_2477 [Bacteroidota bacterium]|jgi:hypothetical protein
MKKLQILILLFVSVCISVKAQDVFELKVIERYTNSFQNNNPKGEVYLVVSFSEDYAKLFFDKNDSCMLHIKSDSSFIKKIHKSVFFKNPKNKFYEYYYFLSKANQMNDLKLFDFYLISTDSLNYTKVSFTDKDKRKVISKYKMPDVNASAKEKLKYYKKTGDRQGQLLGQAPIVEIYRRMKCSAKKRKFRKEGINGVKEMIYGF